MSTLVSKEEICKALNYSAKEIDELVMRRQIPHIEGVKPRPIMNKDGKQLYKKGAPVIHFDKAPGNILFPLEEILKKFTPKPKSAKKPNPEPEKVPEERTEPF